MKLAQEFGYVRDVFHQIEAKDALQAGTPEGQWGFRVQHDVWADSQRPVRSPGTRRSRYVSRAQVEFPSAGWK